MLRYSVLLLVLLQAQITFADEPAPTKSSSPDEIAKLVDRIDQLEKRIKELERQDVRPPSLTVVPKYQPVPVSPTPYGPQTDPAIPYQLHYLPKQVPESWKPFHFNGMQYYIIPVDDADRMNHPQGNDKTIR